MSPDGMHADLGHYLHRSEVGYGLANRRLACLFP